MVRDVPGQEANIEFGVDYGLEEGESLPTDVEELTEAQYVIFAALQTIKGTLEGSSIDQIKGEKGTGLIVPD